MINPEDAESDQRSKTAMDLTDDAAAGLVSREQHDWQLTDATTALQKMAESAAYANRVLMGDGSYHTFRCWPVEETFSACDRDRTAAMRDAQPVADDRGYGYGLYRVTLHGEVVVFGHRGATAGFNTVAFTTERGRTVVLY